MTLAAVCDRLVLTVSSCAAVNHLAGYLLARRLTDPRVSSALARIVQVAAISQRALDLADLFIERALRRATACRVLAQEVVQGR